MPASCDHAVAAVWHVTTHIIFSTTTHNIVKGNVAVIMEDRDGLGLCDCSGSMPYMKISIVCLGLQYSGADQYKHFNDNHSLNIPFLPVLIQAYYYLQLGSVLTNMKKVHRLHLNVAYCMGVCQPVIVDPPLGYIHSHCSLI